MSGSKCANSDFVALFVPAGIARRAGRKISEPVVQQNKACGDSTLKPCQKSALVSQRDQQNSTAPLKPICTHLYQEKSHKLPQLPFLLPWSWIDKLDGSASCRHQKLSHAWSSSGSPMPTPLQNIQFRISARWISQAGLPQITDCPSPLCLEQSKAVPEALGSFG